MIKLWNVCVFGVEGEIVGWGNRVFLEPNPLIDGLSWVGQRLLKGGVCGWRLPSAVCCLIDPGSVVVRGVLLTTNHLLFCVCVCVCMFTREALCLLSVCVSGGLYLSDLALFFFSMSFSHLVVPCYGNFQRFKTIGKPNSSLPTDTHTVISA